MVTLYISPYLAHGTFQDFEELVSVSILQSKDLKQRRVKWKKLHRYVFIYVYKTITGSEKDLYLTSETAFKALIVAIWNFAQKAGN